MHALVHGMGTWYMIVQCVNSACFVPWDRVHGTCLYSVSTVYALVHGIGYMVHDCTVYQQCMLCAMGWGTQYMIVQCINSACPGAQ